MCVRVFNLKLTKLIHTNFPFFVEVPMIFFTLRLFLNKKNIQFNQKGSVKLMDN